MIIAKKKAVRIHWIHFFKSHIAMMSHHRSRSNSLANDAKKKLLQCDFHSTVHFFLFFLSVIQASKFLLYSRVLLFF
jgi:hypothetical protein